MPYVYTFLSAAAAWALVALLTHMEARQAAVNGGIAGAFCALLAILLPLAGITVPLTLAAMLLLAVLLPLQQRPSLRGRLMNLLLSVGFWAFLDYSATALQTFLSPIPALALFIVILAAFLAIGWAVRHRFPQEDWAESKEPSSVRAVYIWASRRSRLAPEPGNSRCLTAFSRESKSEEESERQNSSSLFIQGL